MSEGSKRVKEYPFNPEAFAVAAAPTTVTEETTAASTREEDKDMVRLFFSISDEYMV